MARPRKATVDYFPHVTTHGKTMFILEQRFGNDGYAVFFKVLETLGNTDGHLINCNDLNAWVFLSAYCRIETDLLRQILDLLAELGAINKEFWERDFIYSENFVNGIKDAYRRRNDQLPTLERVSAVINPVKKSIKRINAVNNGESKEKEKEYTLLFIGKDGKSYSHGELFDALWDIYPNRDGKKAALRHYNATVKTEDDMAAINLALGNYLDHLATETWKKPKSGSTWFNNWQDWIPQEEVVNG